MQRCRPSHAWLAKQLDRREFFASEVTFRSRAPHGGKVFTPEEGAQAERESWDSWNLPKKKKNLKTLTLGGLRFGRKVFTSPFLPRGDFFRAGWGVIQSRLAGFDDVQLACAIVAGARVRQPP